MNELIKVVVNEKQEQTVSARELHEFLEIGTHYKDWFPRMTEYGFIEGQDFCSILSESTGGRTEYTNLRHHTPEVWDNAELFEEQECVKWLGKRL